MRLKIREKERNVMWTKKNIVLIALGIIFVFALVLPLNNVPADSYKFLTGTEGQQKQKIQKQEEVSPSDDEITTINSSSSDTDAAQSDDKSSPADNGVIEVQPVTAAQPTNQLQSAPEQQVQNTQLNSRYQPGYDYYTGEKCMPMVPIPKDYQPSYEWYEDDNSWGMSLMGHH